jgi:hypothetical protein
MNRYEATIKGYLEERLTILDTQLKKLDDEFKTKKRKNSDSANAIVTEICTLTSEKIIVRDLLETLN